MINMKPRNTMYIKRIDIKRIDSDDTVKQAV